jgi:hypothetical protein
MMIMGALAGIALYPDNFSAHHGDDGVVHDRLAAGAAAFGNVSGGERSAHDGSCRVCSGGTKKEQRSVAAPSASADVVRQG